MKLIRARIPAAPKPTQTNSGPEAERLQNQRNLLWQENQAPLETTQINFGMAQYFKVRKVN